MRGACRLSFLNSNPFENKVILRNDPPAKPCELKGSVREESKEVRAHNATIHHQPDRRRLRRCCTEEEERASSLCSFFDC